jgi:hypothetical protein
VSEKRTKLPTRHQTDDTRHPLVPSSSVYSIASVTTNQDEFVWRYRISRFPVTKMEDRQMESMCSTAVPPFVLPASLYFCTWV